MTISTVQPGMRAATASASPYTPIAVINGTPIYALRGGRSGGSIAIVAGDADGDDDDDLLDDAEGDYDDGGHDDSDDDLPASMRGKASKAKAKKATARRAVEDDEDDEPDDEDDEDDTPGAIRRMEDAVAKANRTAARYRRAGKTMERLGIDDLPTFLTERGIDPETGRPFGSDVIDPDEGDDDLLDESEERTERPTRADRAKQDRETVRAIRAAEKRAEAKVRAELIPILAQTSATNALRNAGFKGSEARLERLLRMIDPDALDITLEDGTFEIDGLDEQISELQDEFPELFPAPVEAKTTRTGGTRTRPAARRTGARDVDGGGRGAAAKKPAAGGWMDQVAARWDRDGR